MTSEMTRAEEAALRAYPNEMVTTCARGNKFRAGPLLRRGFQEGYEQAEKDTIERIISYLGECDLERTILDFDSDGYANIDFESLEKLIHKAMEEE